MPAGADSVTWPPAQSTVDPVAVIVATGSAFTDTVVAELVAWQPADVYPVTLYEPALLAMMLCVVAPLLQT